MLARKEALRPENEAPRATRWQGRRGTANYINISKTVDSCDCDISQRLTVVPRIIATHWLRAEHGETIA